MVTNHIEDEMRVIEVRVAPDICHDGARDPLSAALKLDAGLSYGLQLERCHVSHSPAQYLTQGVLI